MCLCTLLGIVFLAPAVASRSQANPVLFSVVLNSFAAGVLVSAAFYLLLIEASLFIKTAGLGDPAPRLCGAR